MNMDMEPRTSASAVCRRSCSATRALPGRQTREPPIARISTGGAFTRSLRGDGLWKLIVKAGHFEVALDSRAQQFTLFEQLLAVSPKNRYLCACRRLCGRRSQPNGPTLLQKCSLQITWSGARSNGHLRRIFQSGHKACGQWRQRLLGPLHAHGIAHLTGRCQTAEEARGRGTHAQ